MIIKLTFKVCERKRSRFNGDNIYYLKESTATTYENPESGYRMHQRSLNFLLEMNLFLGLRSWGVTQLICFED